MPETILLALVYAKIKKYDIKPLLRIWAIYPVIIFEVITLIGQVAAYFGSYKIVNIFGNASSIYLICYLFLIIKYQLYIQSIIGSIFVVIGGILNDMAIKANGGFMPVYKSLSNLLGSLDFEHFTQLQGIHILGGSATKLKVLTDFIDLGYTILSIGDILIRIFVFIIIYYTIKKINEQEGKKKC